MNDPIQFYDLYCINVHCECSIFYGNSKIVSHFHVGSILMARLCPTCQSVLVSAMDIELEQITAGAKVSMVGPAVEIEKLIKCN
jgi:hypothetical protein